MKQRSSRYTEYFLGVQVSEQSKKIIAYCRIRTCALTRVTDLESVALDRSAKYACVTI